MQRTVGVLKYHLGQFQFVAAAGLADRFAVKADRAGPAGFQPRQRPQQGRLAATAFADDAKGFAFVDREADAAHDVIAFFLFAVDDVELVYRDHRITSASIA
ncbi:hypothetical protein D3C72_691150 [compost metagenome]